MTDETEPTPQGGAAAGGQQQDPLASWFRPKPKAGGAEGGLSSDSAADDDDDEPRQARAPRPRASEPAVKAAEGVEAAEPSDDESGKAEPSKAGVEPAASDVWSAQPDAADADDEPADDGASDDNVAADETSVIPARQIAGNDDDRTESVNAEPVNAESADTKSAEAAAEGSAAAGDDDHTTENESDDSDDSDDEAVAEKAPLPGANDQTQYIPVTPPTAESAFDANDSTQLLPSVPVAPPAAPTEMLPRTEPPVSGMAVRGLEGQASKLYGGPGAGGPGTGSAASDNRGEGGGSWSPEPTTEPYAPAQQMQHSYQQQYQQAYRAPGDRPGNAPLPSDMQVRGFDDFDEYDEPMRDSERPPNRARRALFATTGVIVLVLVIGAGLVFSGKVSVLGFNAKPPAPTVGFSPSSSDAGTDATQTGTAFLTDWENGNLKGAANIADDPTTALAQLTEYKNDLKLSGLTVQPGTTTTGGWMTFNVTAQVGKPSSAWSYSSGLATYPKKINGYTRWFVKWQPSLLFTSLKAGQHLTLGAVPPVVDKVVDRNGKEITSANAPSLTGIVAALKKSAPAGDGTPGQEVDIVDAAGAKVSKVVKISDPVSTGSVKTTIDLAAQKAAQTAVQRAPNSSMVVIQPSTGNILAVANNPPGGLDIAMVGKYAPGSTFKTVTTTLVLNKGVISNLNQTWDCPKTLNADGITLHNSEEEGGGGESFLWDFAQSCNNAFSRFEGKVSRDELAATAHDYFGFDQKWDVGLGQPTVYGHVPNTSSNSLAEELVGQDQIAASPLAMAAVAATVDHGSFKQPILVPGTAQIPATAIPSKTQSDLKTLMHAAVTNGTLSGLWHGQAGVYGKTGTAEVQGKTANSWTIAFKGDYAVAALAVGGNYGASTAGPECKSLLDAIS